MPPRIRLLAGLAVVALCASASAAVGAASPQTMHGVLDTGTCGAPPDGTAPGSGTMSHPALEACGGIRPGAALVATSGIASFVYCTMGFIVTDGVDLYVSTAAHCTDPDLGRGGRVSALGIPGTFGVVAYRWCDEGSGVVNDLLRGVHELSSCGIGADFSLIRVDRDKHHLVNSSMCHWGPASGGLFTEKDDEPRLVRHFGWGMVVGEPSAVVVTTGNPATQAREGVGMDFQEESHARVLTVAAGGDSGSGVLVLDRLGSMGDGTEPQALGILTHTTSQGVVVQRLDSSLAKASLDLARPLELVI